MRIMKKILLFAMIAMVGCNMLMYAQDEVFPLSGAKWTVLDVHAGMDIHDGADSTYYTYTLKGDTIINDIQRSKVYAESSKSSDENGLLGFFHLDEKKVYFRLFEEAFLDACIDVGEDILLYDFGLNVEDSPPQCEYRRANRITDVDSVMLGQQKRKRYALEYSYLSQYCIEGMGNTGGLFSPIWTEKTCACYTQLVCFSQNDEVLYLSPNFIDCSTPKPLSAEDASTGNFTISPNPAGEVVTVSHPSEVIREVALYDNAGRQLLVRQSDSSSLQLALPYPSGLYHLTITTASGKRYDQKIVKL